MTPTIPSTGTRLVLMYHNVVAPGAEFERIGDSVTRYFVTRETFAKHLEHLAVAQSKLYSAVAHSPVVPNGQSTPPLTEHLKAPSTEKNEADVGPLAVELTFDDGWLGSFDETAALLERFDMTATVFVTTGLIGRRYFADAPRIRAAVETGRFRIGAHGVTHRLLETLSPTDIEIELRESKDTLEQIVDAEVDAFALPGGSTSHVVRHTAKRVGYRELHTSVPSTSPILSNQPVFEVPRFAIQRSTTLETLQQWIDEPIGWAATMKHATLELAKATLGRRRYAAVRRRLLGSHNEFDMTDLVRNPDFLRPESRT